MRFQQASKKQKKCCPSQGSCYDTNPNKQHYVAGQTPEQMTIYSTKFDLYSKNGYSPKKKHLSFQYTACLIGILKMVYEIIPTYLGSFSSPIYPKQPPATCLSPKFSRLPRLAKHKGDWSVNPNPRAASHGFRVLKDGETP